MIRNNKTLIYFTSKPLILLYKLATLEFMNLMQTVCLYFWKILIHSFYPFLSYFLRLGVLVELQVVNLQSPQIGIPDLAFGAHRVLQLLRLVIRQIGLGPERTLIRSRLVNRLVHHHHVFRNRGFREYVPVAQIAEVDYTGVRGLVALERVQAREDELAAARGAGEHRALDPVLVRKVLLEIGDAGELLAAEVAAHETLGAHQRHAFGLLAVAGLLLELRHFVDELLVLVQHAHVGEDHFADMAGDGTLLGTHGNRTGRVAAGFLLDTLQSHSVRWVMHDRRRRDLLGGHGVHLRHAYRVVVTGRSFVPPERGVRGEALLAGRAGRSLGLERLQVHHGRGWQYLVKLLVANEHFAITVVLAAHVAAEVLAGRLVAARRAAAIVVITVARQYRVVRMPFHVVT